MRTLRVRQYAGRIRTRLSVDWCGIADLQILLDVVFDRPVDTGPRFYRHRRGQSILDPGPHADVALEVWWTFGQPVDDATMVDEAEWFGWLSHRDDFVSRRALFLTDVPIDPDLEGRFGVRPNVLSVRPGRASYVAVSYADDPSFAEAVGRLHTAADLMAD